MAPTTFPTGVAKLNVIILAASFAIKQNVSIRKSSTTCEVTGTHDMRVLNLIIKVENDGRGDFIVSPSDLTYDKCNPLIQSYPTFFYSIKIYNTVKTRADICVADGETVTTPRKASLPSTTSSVISTWMCKVAASWPVIRHY